MSIGQQSSKPTWSEVELAELATFRTGPFGSTFHKTDYVTGGVPLINPSHIVDGDIVPDASVTVLPELAKRLNVFALREGEIVIGRRGEMGRCAVVKHKHAGFLCGTGSMIVRAREGVNPHLLHALLSSPEVIAKIEENSVGTTMINLNQGTLSSLKINMANDPKEQQAIAEALSDADGVVEGLERLIEKKRRIKQGAMQDLLTAKRRLPGFSGEWVERKLGSRGNFSKGAGVRKDEAKSGFIPCVRYGELYTLHNDVIRSFSSFISPAVASTARKIKSGDILFAGSGETKEEIGKNAVVVNVGEVYAGSDIIVFRADEDDPIFMSYLLNAPISQKQKARKGQGDAVVHISANALAEIKLRLPEKPEQD